ncbi:branched-chain amino acid ABC transporter permease [Azospirillum endophyticum]
MTISLMFTQMLNGLQFGILLFLMSAGLTLVMGIMNFANLTHGSMYMIGAYIGAATYGVTNSFVLAAIVAVLGTLLVGFIMERTLLHRLYGAEDLYQVLATFGLILVFNQAVKIIWGQAPVFMGIPDLLSGTVDLLGLSYPAYRFAIIAAGLAVGLGLYIVVNRTRVGMWIRAGASDREMIAALGVNIRLVNTLIFAIGVALAGFAGVMAGPLLTIQPGMGEPILILVLVVIVTGGIGSIRGAFYGALIVGLVDTMGRAFMPALLRELLDPAIARGAGPAVASILIYLFMAGVLALKPEGLLPPKYR